ncbi:GNAT family N-acetyltransferase [Streptomyces sp. ISL-10]|uniref:GNAT family N-acetyltransferase n=1 Tax=Streptomyces sp. ISL-10 TaxID=2819172 RepID=UPI001BE98C02|nr:GNAT family N-acetyltransferase [Streptomyces sp. ISL-10]MBT2367529.1 GNAT family N-acetyltransferase [Streptomyces sp. ISL-10]
MTEKIHGAYTISTDPARLDPDRIHQWLSTEAYWALGRSREKQDRAVAGSVNFGAYETTSGQMAGYARIVTDHATFAWLCDVYVDRSARGNGLGTALVAAVRDHFAPLGLRRILLTTDDAHGLYEKLGFKELDVPGNWLNLMFE